MTVAPFGVVSLMTGCSHHGHVAMLIAHVGVVPAHELVDVSTPKMRLIKADTHWPHVTLSVFGYAHTVTVKITLYDNYDRLLLYIIYIHHINFIVYIAGFF